MNSNERDTKLYEKLELSQGLDQQILQPPSVAVGFIIHAVLKCIVLGLFIFKFTFSALFSNLVINQLIAIFVVIDFWFTKNVTGKKMISVRWFFENDEYGTEKFMFECRANEQYVNPVGTKLFWLVLIFYTILPIVLMILQLIPAPFIFINFQSVLMCFGILIGGGANLFFFMKASGASSAKHKQIKKKIGVDLLRRLKMASITSYC